MTLQSPTSAPKYRSRYKSIWSAYRTCHSSAPLTSLFLSKIEPPTLSILCSSFCPCCFPSTHPICPSVPTLICLLILIISLPLTILLLYPRLPPLFREGWLSASLLIYATRSASAVKTQVAELAGRFITSLSVNTVDLDVHLCWFILLSVHIGCSLMCTWVMFVYVCEITCRLLVPSIVEYCCPVALHFASLDKTSLTKVS